MPSYQPNDIEAKWRQFWQDNDAYQVSNDSDRPKFYVLDMFPYPSGSGLHVGHPLGYVASDIYSRYKRMSGFNVLHPMGYDAFGLPAEQYAIENNVHPAVSTAENMARYRRQLDNIGFSFDWSRQVNTSDPQYYKWTQWIFLQLFNHYYDTELDRAEPIEKLIAHFAERGTEGLQAAASEELNFSATEWNDMDPKQRDEALMNYRLAYRKVTYVNWCEQLGTVLANDEVKDGVSERGGFPVVQRPMVQWSLRITAYAQRLLDDLAEVEWSEAMVKMQANWIGRSTGAQLFFDIEGSEERIEIYTTRADTIFGATFMVLAPEHELVDRLTTSEQRAAVDAYLSYVGSRSERERMSETREVTGEFIGAYALNPFNGARIPIYIAEYVLKDYGTGAIMAVPADDERDQRFAEKFGLDIIPVVDKSEFPGASLKDKVGTLINSEFLNGLSVEEAIEEMNRRVEDMDIGRAKVNFRLRDAIYSRQRYWGEPFPIVYDEQGVAHALPENELPLELPELSDFRGSSGQAPLERATDWVNLPDGRRRETDTMPGFAGSSWYFLRYMDPGNPNAFASQEAVNYWRDVDLYVGGTEHAVGHLLYSRMWHKFLYDKGLVPTREPFRKLINQGMIQGVIESLLYDKENKAFVSADLVPEAEQEQYTKMPVKVAYVTNYGLDGSHLNAEGIEQFRAWRSDFAEAEFRTNEDGQLITVSEVGKMSKSKYNVINPDDVIARYGADAFRVFEMFLGPIEQAKPWDIQGIDGVYKFIRRFWELFHDDDGNFHVSDDAPTKAEMKAVHTAIKKVSEDIERFSFNTCVSGFMVAGNELRKLKCHKRAALEPLVRLLAPFAPFLTEELWHRLGHSGSVHHADFPELDESYLKEDSIEYPISVNGKKRATAHFPADASKQDIEAAALELEDLQKWIEGKTVRRVIVVPGRMVNVVV